MDSQSPQPHLEDSSVYRPLWPSDAFPNSLAPIIVLATGYLAEAVIAEAALSFLGLGVPPPDPSWGRMLQEGAREYLEIAPWLTIFPGIALSLAVFGFTLFGDALRDVLDPRLSSFSGR